MNLRRDVDAPFFDHRDYVERVRYGTHPVDPFRVDRHFFGETETDLLYGRASIWPDVVSNIRPAWAVDFYAWVWRRQLGEVPEQDTPSIRTLSDSGFSLAWRAFFACGCESLRDRIYRSESWAVLREFLGAFGTARSWRARMEHGVPMPALPPDVLPRGTIIRTYLSKACALHHEIRETRARWERMLAPEREQSTGQKWKSYAYALWITAPPEIREAHPHFYDEYFGDWKPDGPPNWKRPLAPCDPEDMAEMLEYLDL